MMHIMKYWLVIKMANILGFRIFDGNKDEYVSRLVEKYKSGEKVVVLSGNPEILYNALENETIKAMCSGCDIIPDGIGVILAGKMTGQHFKQKIAGIEVMEDMLKLSSSNNIKVYLLGAEDNIVEEAAKICKSRYNAEIAGFHNGYFDIDNCNDIINSINRSGADILLVAMGAPRQELFIGKYKEILKCRIFMGVGGSFDVLSGKVKRAPRWMINMNLEWMYRVSKEPYRIKRLVSIPKFILKAVLSRKCRGNG